MGTQCDLARTTAFFVSQNYFNAFNVRLDVDICLYDCVLVSVFINVSVCEIKKRGGSKRPTDPCIQLHIHSPLFIVIYIFKSANVFNTSLELIGNKRGRVQPRERGLISLIGFPST